MALPLFRPAQTHARDAPLVEALRYAATTLTVAFSALSFAMFVWLRHWVSKSVIGDPSQTVNVIWAGVAVLFRLGWTFDTSILNADQRVRALAKIGLIKGAFASLLGTRRHHVQKLRIGLKPPSG